MKYSEFAIKELIDRLAEKAMKDSTPKKFAGDMYEAAEVIAQLRQELSVAKMRYDALVKDLRENGVIDICNICVGAQPGCNGETCDWECDTCTRECRCKDCVRDSQWKWRGESDNDRRGTQDNQEGDARYKEET